MNRPAIQKNWERMSAAVRKVFTDPELRAYYPDDFYKETTRVHDAVDTGEVRQRRMVGYQNALRFYRMLDAAGGKTAVGGDTNAQKVAGFVVHDEMEILEEAGIPRMHVIQGATKWAAEALNKQGDVGTVEKGKAGRHPHRQRRSAAGHRQSAQHRYGRLLRRQSRGPLVPLLLQHDLRRQRRRHPRGGGLALHRRAEKGELPRPNNECAGSAPDPVESPQPAIQTVNPSWAKEGDAAVAHEAHRFQFRAPLACDLRRRFGAVEMGQP